MRKSGKNRFIKELEEVNRKSSPADMEMLRELNLMMKQIENIPRLPQTESTAPGDIHASRLHWNWSDIASVGVHDYIEPIDCISFAFDTVSGNCGTICADI